MSITFRNYIPLLIFVVLPTLMVGQHPFTSLAKKSTYSIELGNNRLEGEGAEFLLFEATRSPFFLVGEEGGLAKTPSILWAIYQHAYKIGLRFNHLAVDVNPTIAINLQDLALEPDADRLMQEYFNEQEDIAVTYSSAEEQDMLSKVLSTAESNAYVLWGIGPTKITELRNDLTYLLSLASDRDTEKIVEKYLREAEKAYTLFLKNGNLSTLALFKWQNEDFETLSSLYQEDEEALSVINDLRASQRVHTLTEEAAYQLSPSEQQSLMKGRFRRYYQEALATQVKAPRVMVKIDWGSGFKGNIPGSNVKSFGNYLQAYGKKNNKRAFHLLVLGGISDSVRMKLLAQPLAYGPSLANTYTGDPANDLSPLIAAVPAGEKAVIELAPIRKVISSKALTISPLLTKIVEEYDAVLIVGDKNSSASD
ncbi:MAG: hypothetical protein AAF655_07185 [Bacteroidota bacterium]